MQDCRMQKCRESERVGGWEVRVLQLSTPSDIDTASVQSAPEICCSGCRFMDFLLRPDDAVQAADAMWVCLSIEQLGDDAGATVHGLGRRDSSPRPLARSRDSGRRNSPDSVASARHLVSARNIMTRMSSQESTHSIARLLAAASFRQSRKSTSALQLRITVHSARSLPEMDGMMPNLQSMAPGLETPIQSPSRKASGFGMRPGPPTRTESGSVASPVRAAGARQLNHRKNSLMRSTRSPILPPKFVDFHLRAPDQAGRDRWVKAIRRAVERAEPDPEEDEVDGIKGAQLAVKRLYDHGWVVSWC